MKHSWPVAEDLITAALDQIEWLGRLAVEPGFPPYAVIHRGSRLPLYWCACTDCEAVDLVYVSRLGQTCVWCSSDNIGAPPRGTMRPVRAQDVAVTAFVLGGLKAVRALVT